MWSAIGILATGLLGGLFGMFYYFGNKLDNRFDAVMTRMDARFDAVDAQFDSMTAHMDARFDGLTMRIDAVIDRHIN